MLLFTELITAVSDAVRINEKFRKAAYSIVHNFFILITS
jgi:hypothetical protein